MCYMFNIKVKGCLVFCGFFSNIWRICFRCKWNGFDANNEQKKQKKGTEKQNMHISPGRSRHFKSQGPYS